MNLFKSPACLNGAEPALWNQNDSGCIVVSRSQTAFTRKGSGTMPMHGLCRTPQNWESIIAFHTMRHPATARPQLPVLRKPGVESPKPP